MEIHVNSRYNAQTTELVLVQHIHDRFRYHQKCWYWPDTDTDTRIGAALVYMYMHALNSKLYTLMKIYIHAYEGCLLSKTAAISSLHTYATIIM